MIVAVVATALSDGELYRLRQKVATLRLLADAAGADRTLLEQLREALDELEERRALEARRG